MRRFLSLVIVLFLLFRCTGYANITFEGTNTNTDSILNTLNSRARDAYMKGDFDESRKYLEDVLQLKLKYYSHQKTSLANTYTNLALACQNTWDFENAIELAHKAVEYYSADDSSNINIGKVLLFINYLYINIGDYEKSQQYYNYFINFNDKYNNEEDNYTLYYTKGVIFNYLKDYQNARINWLKYARTAKEKYSIYNNLALNYIQTGEIEEAERYYQKILKLPDLRESEMYLVYLNYGIFIYEHRHDPATALQYFDMALTSATTYHPQNLSLLSQIYHNYGELYLGEKETTRALDYFQKALIAGSADFTDPNYFSNPSLDNIYNLSRVYITLKFKARALHAYYSRYNDIRFLKSSLEVSGICFEVINKMRYRISSEGSLFSISENEKDVYKEAITAAYKLFDLTGDMEFLDRAFQINEMSKAFVLLSHLRTQKAMLYGNIPVELIEKERELHRQLSLYEEQLLLEKQKTSQNQERMKTWEELLAKYNMEYDMLLRKFENEFPDYYDLKYRTEYITPLEIRKRMRKNDAVVAYSVSGDFLYTFIVTREQAYFFRHEVSNRLEQECNDYYRLITSQNFSKQVDETFRNLTHQGYHLYSMLLKPFEEIIDGKNLIIVADGEISYLPFDALITEEITDIPTDYRNLPYLLHKHSVGFSYSSTLHFNHDIKSKAKNKSVLAFAPTYGNLMANMQEQNAVRNDERYNLIILPGIKDEVKNISKYLDADIFLDYKAAESKFKKLAPDYEILHLAMHTILDDTNPLYSKMAFTQLIDTEEDGFLHAFEIYNMQLNAKLAVLSSCSSGFGKLQEGEGMQSLARSFSYAGCPSILMSLWEVADHATVEMMDYFYMYLVQGFSKPEALRLSKLDFINKADRLKSNPFFWSAFIILGDSEPLFSTFRLKGLFYLLAPIIIVLLILTFRIYYIYNRKKRFSWYVE